MIFFQLQIRTNYSIEGAQGPSQGFLRSGSSAISRNFFFMKDETLIQSFHELFVD